MTSPFDKRLDAILKDSTTPLLKSWGFIERGRTYVARRNALAWLVDVQKSRWNDREEAQFTLNGGVYVPGVVSRYSSRPEPSSPKLADCCLSVRAGMLDHSRLDKWWKLSASQHPDDVDRQIGAELSERLENALLPFLSNFDSLDAIVEYLSAPVTPANRFVSPQTEAQRRAFAALIHAAQGNTAEARDEIDVAMRVARGSPIEDVIRKLGRRLSDA